MLAAVVEGNTQPTVENKHEIAVQGVAKLIELSGADGDDGSLKFIIKTLPTNGSLRDALDGQIGFTPRELFGDGVIYTSGTGAFVSDSFTYVVNDGTEDSEPAIVLINFESP